MLTYLGQVISWYRSAAKEARFIDEPDETLFVADNRRTADEVVKFAFDFAHATIPLFQEPIRIDAPSAGEPAVRPQGAAVQAENALSGDLQKRRDAVALVIDQLQAALDNLQAQKTGASRRQRDQLARQTVALQAQLNLADSRLGSIDAMVDFAKDTAATRNSGAGIEAPIDELENSLPNAHAADHAQAEPALASTGVTVSLPSSLQRLSGIRSKQSMLADETDATKNLARTTTQLRQKLFAMLSEVDRQALQEQTARAADSDVTALKQTKAEFETLTRRSKLLGDASLPLSKQIVVLDLYATSLARWRDSIQRQFREASRQLIIRGAGLATLVLALLIAAGLWRHLTFRYIQEPQTRHQLLQLRRVVMVVVVALVLIFGFANELGSLATVMGFAAAGIALALQNVIVSIVGYFYLSGRFGVRAGDRIQLFGIEGDVLSTSFLKITLIELVGDRRPRQPSGRVVSFPNSVVFQPNCNFYRQLPGTSFAWHELRFAFAPTADYRLAEKRLAEIALEIYSHYRDTVERESRAMEEQLNLRVEAPRPQTRLHLTPAGGEIVLRYPVLLPTAAQTDDEIARRLTDAIAREPALAALVAADPRGAATSL